MDRLDHDTPREDALLREIARGDTRAIERLYDLLSGTLYALALRITGDDPGAESAVEAVFVDLWHERTRLESAAGRGAAMAWLMARCRERALERARGAASPIVWHATEPRGRAERLEQWLELDGTSRAGVARRALDDLSDGERSAIEKAYFGGWEVSRIAAEEGRSHAEVMRDLQRGLSALAARAGAAGGDRR